MVLVAMMSILCTDCTLLWLDSLEVALAKSVAKIPPTSRLIERCTWQGSDASLSAYQTYRAAGKKRI